MLKFLFPRLTPAPHKGALLFDAITAKAREPHWYVRGEVPDTIEGRFRLLATIAALTIVKLESEGEAGDALSVSLTERFVEVMESEHRELGLGDPKLGRTVRKLVGLLARRVDIWRSATAGGSGWNETARDSVYVGEVAVDALNETAESLQTFWAKLQDVDAEALAKGRIS